MAILKNKDGAVIVIDDIIIVHKIIRPRKCNREFILFVGYKNGIHTEISYGDEFEINIPPKCEITDNEKHIDRDLEMIGVTLTEQLL